MKPSTDHRDHRQHVRHKASGVTLIEMLFVIGIIAIIVVAALAILNAVRASQDRSTALQQVSSIRSAVATWAGDKPLDFGTTGGLQRVEQLEPWLPARLRGVAGAQSTEKLALVDANPWDGAYEIGPSAGGTGQGTTSHPYRFNLAIRKVPGAEAEVLCRHLEDGAAINPEGDKLIELRQGDIDVDNPAGSDEETPACALPAGSENEVQTILITYRV